MTDSGASGPMGAADRTTTWQVVHRCLLPDPLAVSGRTPLYVRGGEPLSRTALRVRAGESASFGTYFGAVPVAYWREHTRLRVLRLALRVDGAVRVRVKRTDASGGVHDVIAFDVADGSGDADVALERDGWLWCELHAQGGASAVVHDVSWHAAAPRADARVMVGITTFDREADCVRLLERLADDELALAKIDRVVVADQGTRRVRGSEGFDAVAERLRERLTVIVQGNLGGSGGFSRAMAEADDADSTHVLLLDDDVDLEPESLCRLVAFAQLSADPVIVGAQMLSLVEPTRLHSFGERVHRRTMWWGPVDPELSSIDLAATPLEHTPALSRRLDVDFNGWWMCLIPISLVRAAGASLPLFIKWDDAEFGLRAAERGVATVTLPGAALWHMPWTAKDDGLDWQAYFQLRNRVVTALLHGGRGVLGASLPQDVNHLLCAQYGSVALHNVALRDILDGPDHLDAVLRAGPARPVEILRREGQVIVGLDEAPEASTPSRGPTHPGGMVSTVVRAARVLFHQFAAPERPSGPAVHLTRAEGKWWAIGLLDSAVVDSAAGRGVFVVQRSRSTALRELRRAVSLRITLWWRWPRLARRYRDAAPGLSSTDSWRARVARRPDGAP